MSKTVDYEVLDRKIFKEWDRKELSQLVEKLTEDEIEYIRDYLTGERYVIGVPAEMLICDFITVILLEDIREGIMCPGEDIEIDDIFNTWKAIQ